MVQLLPSLPLIPGKSDSAVTQASEACVAEESKTRARRWRCNNIEKRVDFTGN
jgi:hypothetical protein